MPTTDVKKYGETVLEQGKAAIDEVRKPWFAAVGATSLAYVQLRDQLSELPAGTQERLRKLQERAVELPAETQERLKKWQELAGERIDPALVSEKVRHAFEDYAAQAKETYESLAQRGEQVVRTLRRDPRVTTAFAETEELVERAEELVTEKPVTPAKAAGRTTPRKAPARRTTTKA
jgi:heparin binding hemagglutinin HbhA